MDCILNYLKITFLDRIFLEDFFDLFLFYPFFTPGFVLIEDVLSYPLHTYFFSGIEFLVRRHVLSKPQGTICPWYNGNLHTHNTKPTKSTQYSSASEGRWVAILFTICLLHNGGNVLTKHVIKIRGICEWVSKRNIVMMDECFWINTQQWCAWQKNKKQNKKQRNLVGAGLIVTPVSPSGHCILSGLHTEEHACEKKKKRHSSPWAEHQCTWATSPPVHDPTHGKPPLSSLSEPAAPSSSQHLWQEQWHRVKYTQKGSNPHKSLYS